MLNYAQLRMLAIITTVISGGLLAIRATDPATLGISPQVMAWIGIISGMIAVGQGFLPDIRGTATDPEFLKKRIRELPTEDRIDLANGLAESAAADARSRALLAAAAHSDLPIHATTPEAPL